MLTSTPSPALLALLTVIIAWLTVSLTNVRYRSERAWLIFADVERDGRGDVRLRVKNLGKRAAVRIALTEISGSWRHVVEGLGSEDDFRVVLPATTAPDMRLRLEYLDVDLNRHRSERSIDLGASPSIVAETMPPMHRRLLHRYGPFMLE